MDVHTYSPESGGGGASRSAQFQKDFSGKSEPHSVRWPTSKEAYDLYEFFKAGTKLDVILLGEPVEVAVHHVTTKRSKVLCTASTGVCEACQVCGTSIEVSDAQTEYHVPALRKEKDRSYHQCIAVFTAKQFRDQVQPLLAEEGARGMRLDVHRISTQKADIKPVKGSARARSASLPGAFDLLPWIRARWSRPQNLSQPPVRLAPMCLKELDRGPARSVKQLALTADDRLPPEELDAVRAKMAEARARFGMPEPVATPIDPAPAAPEPPPPPAPRPEPERPAPAPVAVVPPVPVAPPVPAPVPAGFVVVTAPEAADTAHPAPLPSTPGMKLTTAERIEADLRELAERHPPRPSNRPVPTPGTAIAAQYRQLRERIAEGHEAENRSRAELKKLAREGHDLGSDRAVDAASALDAVISKVAKGGAL